MGENSPIEKHLSVNMNMSKKDIMVANFLGGLAWGFGTVVGATLVVGLLVWILSFINLVPIIGNFAADVVGIVNQKQPAK